MEMFHGVIGLLKSIIMLNERLILLLIVHVELFSKD